LKTANEDGKISLMSKEIFISHSSEDHTVARKVYEFLKSEGLDCFMDDYDLRPGDEFVTKIPEAIRGSSAVVLIFSTNSDNSSDVTKELELSRTEKKLIIPFRVEKLQPRGLAFILAGITWVDAFQPPIEVPLSKLAERIREILGRSGKEPSPPLSPVWITQPWPCLVKDHQWHPIKYEHLSDFVKKNKNILETGKTLFGKHFKYRRNKYTSGYEVSLKEQHDTYTYNPIVKK
jgi:hypothetical protein